MTKSAFNMHRIKQLHLAPCQAPKLPFNVLKLEPTLHGSCIPQISLSHRIDIVQDKLPCLWAVRSVDLCWVRISPMHLSASPEGLIGRGVGVLAANVYVWALTSILGCKSHLLCWSPQMPSCQISWAECFIHGGVHHSGPEPMHYPLLHYSTFSSEPCSNYHTTYHCYLLHLSSWARWGWAEVSRKWVS